jgi:hypothetical protein
MSIPCDKTFPWGDDFDLVTLTLVFDILIEKFNLGYILPRLIGIMALTFHMTFPYDKVFLWVPKNLTF